MVDSPKLNLRVPEKILAAIKGYCEENELNISQFLLIAACRELGRDDLIAEIRSEGRPRKPSP